MMALLTQKSLQEWKNQQYDKQGGKCALCDLPLENWQKANADHNHNTGHMRGLLHPLCNSILEGKIDGLFFRAGLKGKVDFPDVLENLAKYWREDYSHNAIHPNFVRDQAVKFAHLTREKMINELNIVGCDVDKTYTRDQLVDIFKKKYREKLA